MQDITVKVNNDINSKVDKIVGDVDKKLDEIVLKKQVMVDDKLIRMDSKLKYCCFRT
jgi:cell division protein ZapA (FtsZ GTPase activity inhibitor)